MRARQGTAGHSLATTCAIGSVANVQGVLESLAIIAHQLCPMARSDPTERAGSKTPPQFACQVKGLGKVGQWILSDTIHLDDEVDVRAGRCPGTANRPDHIAFRHRVSG
jgi:hypothetical protein